MWVLYTLLIVLALLAFKFGWGLAKVIFKTIKWTFIILALSIVAFIVYYNIAVDIKYPTNTDIPTTTEVQNDSLGTFVGNNWMQQNKHLLWELYVEGNALQRGDAFGKLNKNLLYYQEKVFMDQIDELVPNRKYQHLLKYFIKTYNRNLTDFVPEENLEEIYAMSESCSHDFDYVGDPYDRQLNFHAAHDLGHAMQDYMMVGCTSFATWGKNSEGGDLIIGRNFDFYMGDDFAKNKEVAFFNPSTGYKFAFVTWPGMTGVCSGMNIKGLTVTINAAKSSMPTGSATPISLLARRILQYAGSIAEAKAIADSTQTFVSESLLIGSATDGRAAIIEKSVDQCALYEAPQGQDWVVCANHYQSKDFEKDENNIENIKNSDSPTRFKRASDLVCQLSPLNPEKAVTILRDKLGTDSASIGYGNELAINQLQGHHSVVFNPTKLLMWVSTAPWQEGEFVCYDLQQVFANPQSARGCAYKKELSIAADSSFLNSKDFKDYLHYRMLARTLPHMLDLDIYDNYLEELISSNPNFYKVYEIAGDSRDELNDKSSCLDYWKKALEYRIPKQMDKERIEQKIKSYQDR